MNTENTDWDLDNLDVLDQAPEDVASSVIANETTFEVDNDCGDACKIKINV